MPKNLRKKVSASLVGALTLILITSGSYTLIEPSVAGAVTDDVNVSLTVTSGITLSAPSDVTLSPALSVSNNSSNASTTWTVTTNDTDGYTLTVEASQDPALQSGSDSFADYTEGTPGTPEQWSVSNSYEFGFSAFGGDVPTATWGTAATSASCGDNGPLVAATRKYRGFDGTTGIQVASFGGVTPTTGTSTTVCLAAAQSGVFAPSGTYTGVITATAIVQ